MYVTKFSRIGFLRTVELNPTTERFAATEAKMFRVIVDDEGRLTLVNPETRKRSTILADECASFVSKIREFQCLSSTIMANMKAAENTERQKLKALGLRNKLEEAQKSKEANATKGD
jgi:hypothetical protein